MIFVIACIYNKTKLVGFRLYDTNNYTTMEISYDKLYNGLARGIIVENLQIDGDKLKGKGGSLNRYTSITLDGYPFGEQAVTIINKEEDIESNETYYTVIDYKGERASLSSKELVKYTYCGKLANGKVMYKNGKYIISAIEGEFTQKDEKRVINKYETKYNLPEIIQGKTSGYILEKDEMKKRLQTRFNWSMIKTKRGVMPKYVSSYRQNLYVAHDTLGASIDEASDIYLGIIEIYRGNTKLYVVDINNHSSYYLYDIIYIGKRWVTLSNKEQISNPNCEDTSIIGLGLTGVVIFNIIDTKLDIQVIPYSLIENKFDLDMLLQDRESNAALTDEDLSRIFKIKEISPYKLNCNVDKLTLPSHRVYGSVDLLNTDGVEQLHRLEITVINEVNHCGTLYGVNDFFRENIRLEIEQGLQSTDLAYFSHHQKAFFKTANNTYDRIRLTEKDQTIKLNINNTELKILGYFALYKKGIVKYWNEVWLDKQGLNNMHKYVWCIDINNTNNQMIIYAEDIKVIYNINRLIELYENDKSLIEEKLNHTNKVRSKTKLVGALIDFDDTGNIVDWDGDVKVKSSNTICGVVVRSNRDYKEGTLTVEVVTPDFKVIDKKSRYGRDRDIKLLFKKEYYAESIKYVANNTDTTIEYDLYGATLNDLKIILALYLRSGINRVRKIVIGNETRYIEPEDFNIGLDQLINKANIIFGIDEDYRFNYRKLITLINIEEVDKAVKDALIKSCMSHINIRGRHTINASKQIVELVIDAISTEDENREYHNKLNKFINEISKH